MTALASRFPRRSALVLALLGAASASARADTTMAAPALRLVLDGPRTYEAGDALVLRLRADTPVELQAPIQGELVLVKPDGTTLRQPVVLDNPPERCHACDPVPGGGPDQCKDPCVKQPFAELQLEPFDRDAQGRHRNVLDQKGRYQVSFQTAAPRGAAAGTGQGASGVEVQPFTFEVTSTRINELLALSSAGSYQIESRFKTKGGVGGQRYWIGWEGYRAIYRGPSRHAMVTVIETDSEARARQYAKQLAPEIRQKGRPRTVAKNQILALYSPTVVSAIWPSRRFVVMVLIPLEGGGCALLRSYLRRYPSTFQ